jgi:hypothetical protein
VDRDFQPMMSSSLRPKSGWRGSQNYSIYWHWKTPCSLQTVHWQGRWLCWKIKLCSFFYLLFK